MKIGILKTDAVRDEWVERFGEYPDMFVRLLGSRDPTLSFQVYDVRCCDYPASLDENDAYIITGSKHGVYEDLPWIHRLLDYVRELHAARHKLIGICFGHQVVAQALGGRVAKADVGWGVGIHHHHFLCRPAWFDDGDLDFPVLVSHQDQVLVPAPGSERLASSEFCPFAVCQIGSHILTLQGHPEFEPGYSREIMQFRRETIGETTYHEGMESLQEAPATERMAAWLLRFLHAGEEQAAA
jgi:GMP synthase (glutamine-hydrolysing)